MPASMPNLMICLRYVACALALALALTPGTYAQEVDCRTAFTAAEETYRNGLFDETIGLLNTCLDRDAFSSEERRQAYRLIGLSYIGKDREEGAREAVRALLEVAPGYQADPVLDPPPFVALVDEMRDEYDARQPAPPRPASSRVSQTQGFLGAFNLQGTGYSDSDGDSANGGGAQLTLGYGFTPALAVSVQLSGASFSDFGGFGSGTLGSFGVGGRFHVGGGAKKLVPFAGAGVSFQSLSLDLDEFGQVDYSGAGGGIEGGILYFISPAFAIDGGVQALFSSLSTDGRDDSITSTTVQFGVGVSWHPAR